MAVRQEMFGSLQIGGHLGCLARIVWVPAKGGGSISHLLHLHLLWVAWSMGKRLFWCAWKTNPSMKGVLLAGSVCGWPGTWEVPFLVCLADYPL